MKGIVLAGGTGSRLFPVTLGVSKHLLAIYDKPMVYYPLSILMLANIRDILIICNSDSLDSYKKLLQDGRQFGVNITYKVQDNANGIAEAFNIGKDFIGNDDVTLILGDNIFFGESFSEKINKAIVNNKGATVFAYHVTNPEDYGIVEFDSAFNAVSIEEKPSEPKSNYAVTGLYIYDNHVIKYSNTILPSDRGELEITAVNNIYMDNNNLKVKLLGRGFAWLDTGTHENMLDASNFVKTIETRQGYKVACLEEIAYSKKWINKSMLIKQTNKYSKTEYGEYLKSLLDQ